MKQFQLTLCLHNGTLRVRTVTAIDIHSATRFANSLWGPECSTITVEPLVRASEPIGVLET